MAIIARMGRTRRAAIPERQTQPGIEVLVLVTSISSGQSRVMHVSCDESQLVAWMLAWMID